MADWVEAALLQLCRVASPFSRYSRVIDPYPPKRDLLVAYSSHRGVPPRSDFESPDLCQLVASEGESVGWSKERMVRLDVEVEEDGEEEREEAHEGRACEGKDELQGRVEP